LWPKLIIREYAYFDKTKKCLKVDEFNTLFKLREPLIQDCPPCFFAGNIKESPYWLVGLNPGYNKKRNQVEREIYDKLGWERTYLTFFDWFQSNKIGSSYYSRFAVFLAGFVGEEKIPKDREQRFRLLSENLVNVDLIPYHSVKISLHIKSEEQKRLISPYLEALRELSNEYKPKILFINGVAFKPILKEMNFVEKSTIRVNDKLKAHIGKCFVEPALSAVWFDKFISGISARARNTQLYNAGKKMYNAGKKIKDLTNF